MTRAQATAPQANTAAVVDPNALTAAQLAALEFAKTTSRRLPPEEEDKTRQPFSAKHTWNGRMSLFPEFKRKVEVFTGKLVQATCSLRTSRINT